MKATANLSPKLRQVNRFSESVRQTKPIEAAFSAAWAVIQPIFGKSQILGHFPGGLDQGCRKRRWIDQPSLLIRQCDDVDIAGCTQDQTGRDQGRAATHHQMEGGGIGDGQAAIQQA